VKLVQNFRSHPHILEFPSKTFYDGDLRSHADTRIVNSFVEWKHHPQPKKRFPIVFHAISGNDEQEASSPSYFNRHEASQVKSYIEMLRLDGLGWHLYGSCIRIVSHVFAGAGDIGIITPYFAQAKKIRLLIQSIAPETKVGSVELFQGDVSCGS
jgi:helicase MOV-10